MKKLLLLAAFVIVAANGCKTRKVLHTGINTSDSTRVKKNTTTVSSSKTDSSNEDIFSQFWGQNEKSDLTIGSVDMEEEFTPRTTGKIYFKADSVKPGDTLIAYGPGGSTLKVYTDKKRKQQVATMQQPGIYKKKVNIKNLRFTRDKSNNNDNISDHKRANIKLNHDSLQAALDSVNTHNRSAKASENKTGETKGFNFNFIIIGAIALLLIAVLFYFGAFKKKS